MAFKSIIYVFRLSIFAFKTYNEQNIHHRNLIFIASFGQLRLKEECSVLPVLDCVPGRVFGDVEFLKVHKVCVGTHLSQEWLSSLLDVIRIADVEQVEFHVDWDR